MSAATFNKDWDTDYTLIEPDREFPMVVKIKRYGKTLLVDMQKHAEFLKRLTLEQCDPARFHLNKTHRGQGDWASRELEQMKIASVLNMKEEAQALRERGRKKEAARVEFMGPQDPWKTAKHGPIVEVILSAHHKYFLKRTPEGGYVLNENGEPVRDIEKGRVFLERARQVLSDTFGMRIAHMREDRDEMADHMHAIIIDWTETKTKTKGTQLMITPTKHKLLKTWEKAQTEFAKSFEDLGIVRARDIARQRREAEVTGEKKPEKPVASNTYIWRQQQKKAAADAVALRIEEERKLAAEQARIEDIKRREETYINTIRAGAKAQAAKQKAEIEAERVKIKEATAKLERDRRSFEAERDEGLSFIAREKARIGKGWSTLRAKATEIRKREDAVGKAASVIAKMAKWISPLISKQVQTKIESELQEVGSTGGNPTIPGTFLVSEKPDLKALNEKLMSMTNRQVRVGAIISHDASMFVENETERHEAKRGWLVLRAEAEQRGIDIESGKHDPSKGTSKARAHLHTDQSNQPVLEMREEVIRQMVR